MNKVVGKSRIKEFSENYLPHKLFRRDKEATWLGNAYIANTKETYT